jgi:hypothetical protein
MSVTLNPGESVQFWIPLQLGGQYLSALPAGVTLELTSGDMASVLSSLDSSVAALPAAIALPSGYKAVASGIVSALASAPQPGQPVTLTLAVKGGATVPDEATVHAGWGAPSGTLFGGPVAPTDKVAMAPLAPTAVGTAPMQSTSAGSL